MTTTELALPAPEALPALFAAPDKIDGLISEIEAQCRAHEPDTSTKKGRDAIASLAHKVARSKTALDNAGKQLNEQARQQISVVDAERRKIRERFDALKDEVRKPLTDWEKAEADRVARHKASVSKLAFAGDTHEDLADTLAKLKAFEVTEAFEEFETEAHRAKAASIEKLEARLAEQQRIEAERAELERLRAEAAAREEADRKRREAEEAEAKRIAAQKAEAERQARIEREKQEAAQRAAREAEARAKAEQERLAREAAEREAKLKREIEEAKAREARAAQAERDRIAAERRAADEARAKREADQKHRDAIAAAIAKSIKTFGVTRDQAIALTEALMSGKIPHCEVQL